MVEKRIVEGECPSYYTSRAEVDHFVAELEQALKNAPRGGFPKGGCVISPDLPPPPEEIWLAEQHVDAREAERLAYEAACGNYYDAQQRHFEARIAWGTEYAEEHYPVPDLPTPPCDGSYTEPWESTEAIHGGCCLAL